MPHSLNEVGAQNAAGTKTEEVERSKESDDGGRKAHGLRPDRQQRAEKTMAQQQEGHLHQKSGDRCERTGHGLSSRRHFSSPKVWLASRRCGEGRPCKKRGAASAYQARSTWAEPSGAASGCQAVTAALGQQELRFGGVLLDLLAQTVDVGFQRMGGNFRIVAPDLAQQPLSGDRFPPRTIKISEDLALLFGQANLVTFLPVHEELVSRLEGEGPDREDGILAVFILPQLRAQARQQHAEAEGLGDIVIGPEILVQNLLGILITGVQHQNRCLHTGAPELAAEILPLHVRQLYIQQQRIEIFLLRLLERRTAIRGLNDREFTVEAQLFDEHVSQGGITVGEEDLAHAFGP